MLNTKHFCEWEPSGVREEEERGASHPEVLGRRPLGPESPRGGRQGSQPPLSPEHGPCREHLLVGAARAGDGAWRAGRGLEGGAWRAGAGPGGPRALTQILQSLGLLTPLHMRVSRPGR